MTSKHPVRSIEPDPTVAIIRKHSHFKQSLLIVFAVFATAGLIGFGGYAVLQNLGALAEEVEVSEGESTEEFADEEDNEILEEEFVDEELEEEQEEIPAPVPTPTPQPVASAPSAPAVPASTTAVNGAGNLAVIIKKAFLDTVPNVRK